MCLCGDSVSVRLKSVCSINKNTTNNKKQTGGRRHRRKGLNRVIINGNKE